jgi:UDPglucose--hexose-1-phosphate uridylyltransferase
MTFFEKPHRRQNALTGEWVLVSPQRTKRPWQGSQLSPQDGELSCHDQECYLCPGNKRAEGKQNPDYTGPYIFQNDFSSYTS